MRSLGQMQARVLGRRSPGRSNFEADSEMEGMRGKQMEGEGRLWETGQMLILRRKPVERGEPTEVCSLLLNA